MIVADNSLLAGFAFPGDAYHADAKRIRQRDPDWHAPWLYQSELRSVAAGYQRKGESLPNILAALAVADDAAAGHHLTHQEVLRIVAESSLSAYDSEYVALARRLGCQLVTSDHLILAHYPGLAVHMQEM